MQIRPPVIPAEVLADVLGWLDRNHADSLMTVSRRYRDAGAYVTQLMREVSNVSFTQKREEYVVKFDYYELSKRHKEKVKREVSKFRVIFLT